MADAIIRVRRRSAAPTRPCHVRDRQARPAVPGRGRRPASATPSCWSPPTPPRACVRASTSSRSPSTSRSGCTPPGKIPGSFFRREGRPTDQADPHLPPDRPAAAPVVPRRLPQRDPGRRHRHRRRPGEPPRRARHQRRVRAADAVGHPVRRARSAPCASPTAQDGTWIPHPTYEEGDESHVRARRRRP